MLKFPVFLLVSNLFELVSKSGIFLALLSVSSLSPIATLFRDFGGYNFVLPMRGFDPWSGN